MWDQHERHDYAGRERDHRFRPVEVTVDERGVESALRLFKRLVLKDGILRELKRRRHYEKPGDRRRRKAGEAVRRRRKQAARALRRGEVPAA
jgi:small subunit ribosomal protein S21